MNSTYPKIIIFDNDIELIEQIDELHNYVYNLDEKQRGKVIILDRLNGYKTLEGKIHTPIDATTLGSLVKVYLAKEGHCCLSKITTLTVEQAFNLLEL